ncbi:bifunctional diguanylate cyclase/phosphodiesterase [Fusibacter sp. 3D3]|uniref:putative bifunctional diguanylate cyclase/phosphodiesterase n=1 Tax=Fusibacter sp. 3D3 TaxID=1048380 RepID=UPI0008537DBD|nr:GGDEF and EAL domain-containing protein [Fusibacter sp. 3D3]GAU76330.1 diguanylate cyclase/phosphodiesterase [Fusibacter sp. 3D3]
MLKEYRKKLINWMIHILIIQIVLSTFSSLVSLLLINISNRIALILPLLGLQLTALIFVLGIKQLVKSESHQLAAIYAFMVGYVILQTFIFIDYKGFFIILLSLTWYISYLTLYRDYKKMVLFILVTMYLFFVFAYKNYQSIFQFTNIHLIALLNYFIVSAYIGFDLKRFNDEIAKTAESERNALLSKVEDNTFELHSALEENKRLEHLDDALVDKVREFELQNEALVSERNRFQLILDASNEVLWDLDMHSGKRHFSDSKIMAYPEFYSFTDKPEEWYEQVHPDDKAQIISGHRNLMNGQIDYFSMEFRHFYKGEYQWFLSRSLSLRDEHGKIIRIAGSYSWIHPQKQKDLEIESYTFYDILTGFPNRSKLIKDLFEIIQKFPTHALDLYFMDLYGFREINNTYGHSVGDEIIKAIANRMQVQFKGVQIYRINGPEFLLIDPFHHLPQSDMLGKIRATFETPFHYVENAVHISYNVGISSYPTHGLHPEVLLKHADTALYHAKMKGIRKSAVYDDHMTDDVTSKTVISNLLYSAIKTDEFIVYYQPIYDLSKNKLYGFEALLRWFNPQIGQISPARFIPIAEETGIIVELGPKVIEMACKGIQPYVLNDTSLKLSVNVSAKQIIQDQFINQLDDIIESTQFPKQNLCLEITESVLIESFDLVIDKLNYLRNSGYTIALDDFGTGYSSLNYLSQLPISTLKIDKSFIDRIHDRSQEYYLLKSMITLAQDLKLSMIVEGVETKTQKDLLEKLGCSLFQGFYFSRPLDPIGLEKMMGDLDRK